MKNSKEASSGIDAETNDDSVAALIDALRISHERYKEAARITKLGHWTLDLVNGVLEWSDEIFRIFEIDPELFDASYEGFLNVIHPDDRELVDRAYTNSLKDKTPYEIEHRLLMSNGVIKWVSEQCRTDFSEDGTPLSSIGTVLDVTERKQAEETIRQMAYHDHLTGLPNRPLFYDRLKQSLALAHRNRKQMALLILDLDHFKPINDELGHEYGDQALIEVSKRLLESVRKTDTVSRIGGDEFSIILNNIDSEEAAGKMAGKVIAAIGQPLPLQEFKYTLGISIGIYLTSRNEDDIETAVRRADDAMYSAKKSGRNCYRIYGQKNS